MQDIRKTIEILRDETSECELLGILAVDGQKREEHKKRAANNQQLLAAAELSIRLSEAGNEENPKS